MADHWNPSYTYLTRRRKRLADMAASGVGPVTPSPAMWLSREYHVGDCAYIEVDEEVVQSALKRLTYAHRVDHCPSSDYPALEALEIALEKNDRKHPDMVARYVKEYKYLATLPEIEPQPKLEEMWG